MAEEKINKMQSRKFIVWIVWVLICFAFVVLNFIRSGYEDLTKEAMQDCFFISMFYLGANVANKGIAAYENKQKEEQQNE